MEQHNDSKTPKLLGAVIRWLGVSLGLGAAALYETMVIIAPPPDWQHMRPRAFVTMYVGAPLLIVVGTYWVSNWIARRIDGQKDRGAQSS